MRDDDALDLSAWDAPPPPDGITDAVIARMGGTAVGPAMPDEPPSRKRWLVIAASAAAVLVVAVGAWALVRGREHAPPASGEVVADRAQHVDLGGATVELDRGGAIRWQRTGGHLHVEQKAGTAVWRVGEEHVEIAAAVASIDAAGASLRVEVPMNLSDARVIGASTVTAAAVAMVTVVVYEGHVNVRRGEQTVVVQPGSTYTVPQPQPPPAPPVVGVATGKPKVAILGLEGWSGDAVPRDLIDGLRARAKVAGGPFVLAPASEKELVDEKLLHDCADEEPACMASIGTDLGADVLIYGAIESRRAGYRVVVKRLDVAHREVARSVTELIPPGEAEGAALASHAKAIYAKLTGDCDGTAFIDDGKAKLAGHSYTDALAAFEQALTCDAHDGWALELAYTASCKLRNVPKARLYWQRMGASTHDAVLPLCLEQGITRDELDGVVKKKCDAEDLITKGEGADTRGDYAAALMWMEKALACDPSQAERVAPMVVMESCKGNEGAKALQYLDKVKEPLHSKLAMVCARQGVTSFVASCDADALQQKGTEYVATGQHAAALSTFEQALACKPGDAKLTKLAFMEACNSKNITKAKRYYNLVPADQRGALAQLCMREGITTDALADEAASPGDGQGTAMILCKPAARIEIDGKDTGQTTPATIKLLAGKHKLTLVLGGDRFTYPLTVKAGETATISKDLE